MGSINQLITGSTILYQELLCTKLKDIYIYVYYMYICIYIYIVIVQAKVTTWLAGHCQIVSTISSDKIFHVCCRTCAQASPLCSVYIFSSCMSIAGHPGNGLHRRHYSLFGLLGGHCAAGGAPGTVHRQVHLNRLPCCMPGTGSSGGTAACFLTGLRPPEPGAPSGVAGRGGGPAVLG